MYCMEDGPDLGSSVLEWLGLLQLEEPAQGEPVLVPVELGQAAAVDPRLAQLLLTDAERVRVTVIDTLVEGGVLPRAQRLWLRPTSLLALRHSVADALAALRTEPRQQLNITGVCCAASSLFQCRYSSTHACAACGKQSTVLEGEGRPACCGGLMEEELSKRVMVAAQLVLLGPEAQVGCSGGRPLLAPAHLPVLLLDDLCGRVAVGDVVLACCRGRHAGPVAPDKRNARFGTLWSVQADALGLAVLPPGPSTSPADLPAASQRHLADMATGDLGAVLATADAWVGSPCGPLVQLALLLSCAAAGCQAPLVRGPTDPNEDEPALAGHGQRRGEQVHVLLFSQEPVARRLAERLAAGLCRVSVRGGPAPAALLPRLDARADPDLPLPAPLHWGGQLGEANRGVLLLPGHALDGRSAASVAGYVQAGQAVLQASEPAMPVTATVWCTLDASDLGRGAQGRYDAAWADQVSAKLGSPFLGLFDVALDCDKLLAAGAVEAWAEQLLDSGDGPLLSADAEEQQAAAEALQYHLQVAQALVQPQMTEAATRVLSSYFLSLRTSEHASQEVIGSLVRIASACARLCHRLQVESFPDAALAVALAEESLLAKGGAAALWSPWRQELLAGTALPDCLAGLLRGVKGMGQGLLTAAEQ